MNDDVKKALEWLRGVVRTAKQEGDLFTHAEPLLAHIDGEHARLASAREEQREALGLDRWPTLIPFVAAMARKLDANKAKKGGREGWQNQEPGSLVRRVIEEAEELEHAVDTKGAREILLEAADVANMAMMVADASGALDATPLTATPLADRIAELEATLRRERDLRGLERGGRAVSDTKLTAEESCRSVLKSIVDACDQESLARAGGYLFRYVQEETVLRDCGQRGVCRTPPGCARHWEERNRELVRENEVLRSNSDHLSSENASLSSQVEAMAMRIESLSEELAKPEDMRLREVLEALDGRAVIFDGLGARVGHLLDEMDEWIARAGESERLADERLAHANQLQADIENLQARVKELEDYPKRLAMVLGWMNIPAVDVLERDVKARNCRIESLVARVEELEAQRDVRQRYGDRMKDERDAALARVKELEGALLASCREKVLHGHTTVLLTDALRLKVPGVENYEDWGAERRSKLREAEAERDTLKAQLAEAVEVLRRIAGPQGMGFGGMDGVRLAECARAFLAKYPEGR